MADGVAVTAGSGTTIATDDIGGVHYQRVKLTVGADGTADDVADAHPIPVSDAGATLSVDDGAGSLTVDGTVAVSGTVTVDSELTTADLDTGAGTDTRAVVGLAGTASGGAQLIPGSSTDGLLVNLGANNDVTVTGTVTVQDGGGAVSVDDNGSTLSVDDGAGSLTVDGTVTANIGTSGSLALDATVSGLHVAQASTTSGQTGALAQGAVTTAAPSYTTAKTSPLSLTTAGALRTDGSAVTQPVSGTVTIQDGGNVISIDDGASTISVDDGAGSLTVDGTVTANAGTTANAPTLANVSSSATSVTVFSSNSSALGRMLHNDSTAVLYLKFGSGAASATSYTVKIAADGYYEFPRPCYTGACTGIWSAANGSARTTELT